MALQKLVLRPGVNKEGTNYANENGFYNSDKVRFRSGYAEKIGGWVNDNINTTYKGVARSLFNWSSLTGENLLSIGTSQKFYVQNGSGGTYNDITPVTQTITLTNPFTTVNGSTLVTVTAAAHGATPGTYVTFSGASAVGGLTLNGEFEIVTVPNANTFTIISTITASSSATGGGTVTAVLLLNAGSSNYYSLIGWGTSGWGVVPWGSSTSTISTSPFRLWSQSNYDQDLIFAPRNGAIYYWTKNTTTFARAITLNAQANAQNTSLTAKAVTTAQWKNGDTSILVADTTGIGTGETVTDGSGIPTGAYVATTWNYSTTVPLINPATGSAATLTNAQTTLNGNINASATTIVLTSGTGFPASAGVIIIGTEQIYYATCTTNTLTGCVRAYNGTTAATHNSGDTVYNYTPTTVYFSYAGYHVPNQTLVVATSSQNAFTIAFGSNPYSPTDFNTTFDPLLVRWSDQDNPYEWVPEPTNQSGEQRLSNGSAIITASNTRQEILIWTDTALYSMQYLGPPYVFGINLLMDNISIASQNATVSSNNITYWMGIDRFYSYSGRVETLPCTLRQWVFGNINKSQLNQVCCGLNAGFNEVWWFYPTADSNVNNAYVVFNYLENTWVYGTMNRSAWLYAQLRGNPLGASSVQNSYLAVALTTDPIENATVVLLDASSYPAPLPDKAAWITVGDEIITYTGVSGNTLTGCTRGAFDTSIVAHSQYSAVTYFIPNQVMNHEIGYDDNSRTTPSPIYASIESSDFDIGDGLNFAYVWRIIPDLTFSGSTVANPKCQLTVKVRQNSGAAYTLGSTDSNTVTLDSAATTTYAVEVYTGQVYTRVRGRQMGFRMASTDLGVFWQMGMMRIDVRPDGRR